MPTTATASAGTRSLVVYMVMVLAALLVFSGTAAAQSIAVAPMGGDAQVAMAPAPEMGGAMAPAPSGLDCTDAMLNLSSCLTYVEDGSNLTVPDTGCCDGLPGLVNNQPVCLCKLLVSNEVYGVKIDTAKALTLPTVCRVQAPSVSLCSLFGIPVPSPMGPSMAPSPGISGAPGSSQPIGSSTPTAAPSGSSRLTAKGGAAFLLLLSVISIITISI